MKQIEKKMHDVFEKCGIIVFDDEQGEPLNIDSLTFISLIVQIESSYQIEIPDVYLSGENLSCFDDYCSMVYMIVKADE